MQTFSAPSSAPRHCVRRSLGAPARRRSAFTLLELVLVMAILCIAMGMAAPSLRGFGRGRGAGDAAAQLVALGGWARTQAISHGLVYRLNLDPAARTYWLTVQVEGDSAFELLGEEFGRTFAAPEGVAIDWDAPERPDGRYVEFHPSGRTEPAAIQLTDAEGVVTEVACLSATETFRAVPAGTAAAEAASRATATRGMP